MVATDAAVTNQATRAKSLKAQTTILLQILQNNNELRAMGEPELAISVTLLPGIKDQVTTPTKRPPPITISDSQRPNRRNNRERSAGDQDHRGHRSTHGDIKAKQIQKDELLAKQLAVQPPSNSRVSAKDRLSRSRDHMKARLIPGPRNGRQRILVTQSDDQESLNLLGPEQ